MCGICGIIGSGKACCKVMDGLNAMVYRGYDSAGIAVHNEEKFEIMKAEGDVDNLRRIISSKENFETLKKNCSLAIGHTRWATHGKPCELNAHPIRAGNVVLCHNGTIENYAEIKFILEEKNYILQTDTDTEVLAMLIHFLHEQFNMELNQASEYMHRFNADTNIVTDDIIKSPTLCSPNRDDLNNSLSDYSCIALDTHGEQYSFKRTDYCVLLVAAALKFVSGTFGIIVGFDENPDLLITARRGSPLLVSCGTSSSSDVFLIASDAAAVLAMDPTRESSPQCVRYLEDDELCSIEINPSQLTSYKLNELYPVITAGIGYSIDKDWHSLMSSKQSLTDSDLNLDAISGDEADISYMNRSPVSLVNHDKATLELLYALQWRSSNELNENVYPKNEYGFLNILSEAEIPVGTVRVSFDNDIVTEHKNSGFFSEISTRLEDVRKGGFKHFTLKEIFEQNVVVANALRGRLRCSDIIPASNQNTERYKYNVVLRGLESVESNLEYSMAHYMSKADRIIFIGCGTSWHSATLGAHFMQSLARIHSQAELASELLFQTNPVLSSNVVAVFISQSGETADVISTLKTYRGYGIPCFGIVNSVSSTIARESHSGAYIHAGPEIGVASSKAFTGQLIMLLLIALRIAAEKKTISYQKYNLLCESLIQIPSVVHSLLGGTESFGITPFTNHIKRVSKSYVLRTAVSCLYLGSGIGFSVALEGALKLKELSYIHAEALPISEMKHGHIALIDSKVPIIVIAPKYDNPAFQLALTNCNQIKARGGELIIVTDMSGAKEALRVMGPKLTELEIQALITETIEGPSEAQSSSLANNIIVVPMAEREFQANLHVLPLQLLAYYVARGRGCPIDRPRNLAKSVTFEGDSTLRSYIKCSLPQELSSTFYRDANVARYIYISLSSCAKQIITHLLLIRGSIMAHQLLCLLADASPDIEPGTHVPSLTLQTIPFRDESTRKQFVEETKGVRVSSRSTLPQVKLLYKILSEINEFKVLCITSCGKQKDDSSESYYPCANKTESTQNQGWLLWDTNFDLDMVISLFLPFSEALHEELFGIKNSVICKSTPPLSRIEEHAVTCWNKLVRIVSSGSTKEIRSEMPLVVNLLRKMEIMQDHDKMGNKGVSSNAFTFLLESRESQATHLLVEALPKSESFNTTQEFHRSLEDALKLLFKCTDVPVATASFIEPHLAKHEYFELLIQMGFLFRDESESKISDDEPIVVFTTSSILLLTGITGETDAMSEAIRWLLSHVAKLYFAMSPDKTLEAKSNISKPPIENNDEYVMFANHQTKGKLMKNVALNRTQSRLLNNGNSSKLNLKTNSKINCILKRHYMNVKKTPAIYIKKSNFSIGKELNRNLREQRRKFFANNKSNLTRLNYSLNSNKKSSIVVTVGELLNFAESTQCVNAPKKLTNAIVGIMKR